MKYFTSDWHLGHESASGLGVRVYSKRPFATIDEMDKAIVDNTNEVVGYNDDLYIIGDLTLANYKTKPELTERILDMVRGLKCGKIFLVPGNHDRSATLDELACIGVTILKPLVDLKIGKHKVVLCHYPLLYWNGSNHGSYMLHGHMHNDCNYPFNARIMDVGVDAHNFRPISWEKVHETLKDRPLRDHHGGSNEEDSVREGE